MTDMPHDVEARLSLLEAKIDSIMRHLGMNPSANARPAVGAPLEILELVRSGHKLEAIKVYRELTGVGLREAKEFVESLS